MKKEDEGNAWIEEGVEIENRYSDISKMSYGKRERRHGDNGEENVKNENVGIRRRREEGGEMHRREK